MGFSNISRPKRSLGQNFFVNINLGKHLVEKTLENNPEKVIEIGPGRGFFTKLFVEKKVDILAIEKDNILSENLKFLFPDIEVVNSDIFEEDILHVFQNTKNTVCFGSLPYNIAKRIISYLAQNSDIENFYFIIQKEVAEKYASKGKSSVLSVTTKLYFDSKIVCHIAPENFKPRPNVTSTFIHFSRNKNLELVENVEDFLKYLHKAFKQPRKKLKNNLEKHYLFSNDISESLEKRSEEFDLDEHLEIYKNLKPKSF